jgi:hypothetical protein
MDFAPLAETWTPRSATTPAHQNSLRTGSPKLPPGTKVHPMHGWPPRKMSGWPPPAARFGFRLCRLVRLAATNWSAGPRTRPAATTAVSRALPRVMMSISSTDDRSAAGMAATRGDYGRSRRVGNPGRFEAVTRREGTEQAAERGRAGRAVWHGSAPASRCSSITR